MKNCYTSGFNVEHEEKDMAQDWEGLANQLLSRDPDHSLFHFLWEFTMKGREHSEYILYIRSICEYRTHNQKGGKILPSSTVTMARLLDIWRQEVGSTESDPHGFCDADVLIWFSKNCWISDFFFFFLIHLCVWLLRKLRNISNNGSIAFFLKLKRRWWLSQQ